MSPWLLLAIALCGWAQIVEGGPCSIRPLDVRNSDGNQKAKQTPIRATNVTINDQKTWQMSTRNSNETDVSQGNRRRAGKASSGGLTEPGVPKVHQERAEQESEEDFEDIDNQRTGQIRISDLNETDVLEDYGTAEQTPIRNLEASIVPEEDQRTDLISIMDLEEADVSENSTYYGSNPVLRIDYKNDSTTDEKKEIQENSTLYRIVNSENSEVPFNDTLKIWKKVQRTRREHVFCPTSWT
ncbi:hypothetical protein Q1695_003687 [Nippostrongylus brasiliensis]|nr:hypothetical protein Q1695_003687 [Nippostrongylus brasiliensis]